MYPDNRIVLNYAGIDDLFLIAAVDIATGISIRADELSNLWPGPTVERFPDTTLSAALARADRIRAEGFVVHHRGTDSRTKIK